MYALLLFFLLLPAWAEAAPRNPSPECPYTGHSTCSDGVDNDIDGTKDEAAPSAAFSGSGPYNANVKDCQLLTYTTASDATAASGTYVKKTSTEPFYNGEIACAGSFTNATYYLWVRYRTSETISFIWVKSGSTHGLSPANATNGAFLPVSATFQWTPVGQIGSLNNVVTCATTFVCQNETGQRTFTLSGTAALFIKATAGVELDCFYLSTSATASPECPTGGGGVTVNYEILELGAETEPTAWNSAAFTNANVMTFSGFDNSSLTCTVKMLWDNNTTDRIYVSADCNDTEALTSGSITANDDSDWFNVAHDNIEFRWRADLNQTKDTDFLGASVNLSPWHMDGRWPGGNLDTSYTLNTTKAVNTVASTSWQIFMAFDAGSNIAPDTNGICNFVVRDRDSGGGSVVKHFFGTTINGMTNLAEFGVCKFSNTTVPASGGGGDSTAPTVSNTAETNITSTTATITFDTNESGTESVVYGTSSGNYTETVTDGTCSANCSVALTGLSPSTTYFYKARVTDAAGNTGLSTEDSFTTSASTATIFASSTGSGTACTSGSPCTVAQALTNAVAGDIVELANGTYTGSSGMVAPPSGKSGTAASPITVRCATDGGCLVNGQNARIALHLNNNDFWVIRNINFANGPSTGSPCNISTSADNNKFQRVICWNGTNAVWSISNNTGNLLEDVAGFGQGRKIFATINVSNMTIRRAWGCWENSSEIGPKMTFTINYNNTNMIYENVIGCWNEAAMSGAAVNQPYGILAMDRSDTVHDVNVGYYGSFAYVLSGQEADSWIGAVRSDNDSCNIRYEHVYVLIQGHSGLKPFSLLNDSNCGSTSNKFMTRTTQVGGATSTVQSQWSQSGNEDVDAVASASNPLSTSGSTGARLCKKYENGTLTSEGLFDSDWGSFFVTRLNAAISAAGKSTSTYFGSSTDLKDLIQDLFGTIPAECQ